jgi:hypothetical protein
MPVEHACPYLDQRAGEQCTHVTNRKHNLKKHVERKHKDKQIVDKFIYYVGDETGTLVPITGFVETRSRELIASELSGHKGGSAQLLSPFNPFIHHSYAADETGTVVEIPTGHVPTNSQSLSGPELPGHGALPAIGDKCLSAMVVAIGVQLMGKGEVGECTDIQGRGNRGSTSVTKRGSPGSHPPEFPTATSELPPSYQSTPHLDPPLFLPNTTLTPDEHANFAFSQQDGPPAAQSADTGNLAASGVVRSTDTWELYRPKLGKRRCEFPEKDDLPEYQVKRSKKLFQQRAIDWLTQAGKATFDAKLSRILAGWGVKKSHKRTCVLLPSVWAALDPLRLADDFDFREAPLESEDSAVCFAQSQSLLQILTTSRASN